MVFFYIESEILKIFNMFLELDLYIEFIKDVYMFFELIFLKDY